MCASTSYLRRCFLYIHSRQRSIWTHSSDRVNNDVQRLIFDIYSCHTIFGCGFGLGQYNCYGMATPERLFCSEWRLPT